MWTRADYGRAVTKTQELQAVIVEEVGNYFSIGRRNIKRHERGRYRNGN